MATTAAQLHQYCLDHGFTLTQTTSHWSLPHMSINWWTIGIWAAGIATAYTVGRVGLTQAWSDVTSIGSWIKGLFSGSQTTASTTTTSNPA